MVRGGPIPRTLLPLLLLTLVVRTILDNSPAPVDGAAYRPGRSRGLTAVCERHGRRHLRAVRTTAAGLATSLSARPLFLAGLRGLRGEWGYGLAVLPTAFQQQSRADDDNNDPRASR